MTKNITDLVALEHELAQAIQELNTCHAPSCSSEDIEDVSDSYQERLEYNYWVEEMNQLIDKLSEEINMVKARMTIDELQQIEDHKQLEFELDLDAFECQSPE